MSNEQYPPFMHAGDNVILFDGVCRLCNAWSRFIIRFDKQHKLRLASVQSEQGQAILTYFDMPLEVFETMLYVENGQPYEKSTAILRIIKKLPWYFRIFAVAQIIPAVVRDWMYDRIALNRYRLFGKYDQCLLPSADHDTRFLS